jgi:hypothetical protein
VSLSRLITAVTLVFIAGTTIWLSGPVSQEIEQRLEAMKNEGIAALESIIGMRIGYASVSPSVFSVLELRELTLSREQETDRPLLTITKVRVHYRLLSLIHGDYADGIREISISGARITFNTETDMESVERFVRPRTQGNPTPFHLPRISGRNISLSLSDPAGDFIFTNIFFQLSQTEEGYRVHVKSAIDGSMEPPPNTQFPLESLRTEFAVTGTIGKLLDSADIKLSLKQVETNLARTSPQNFRVIFRDKIVTFIKVQDRAPIDVQGSFSIPDQRLAISFTAEGFRPSTFISLDSRYTKLIPWLSVQISGKGTIEYGFERKDLRYSGNIRVRGDHPMVGGRFTCKASVKGDLEKADFSFLSFTSPYGSLDFYGSLDITNFIPTGRVDIRTTLMEKELSTTAFISYREQTFFVYAQFINFGPDQLYGSILRFSRDEDGFEYLLTGSVTGGNPANGFSIEGNFLPGPEPYLQVSASLRQLPIGVLASIATKEGSSFLPETISSLSISSELFLSTDFSRFSFVGPRMDIRDRAGQPVLTCSATGNNEEISVKNIAATWNRIAMRGEILLSLSPDSYAVSLTGDLGEISYSIEAVYIPDQGVFVSGPYGLDGAVLFREKTTSFSLATRGLPIPFFTTVPELSINMKGSYTDRDQWEFFLYNTRISNLPIPTLQNMITITGRFSSRESTITYISYVDSVSSYSGNGLIAIDGVSRHRGSGWIALSNPEKGESLQIRGEVNGRSIDVSGFFRNLNIKRFTTVQVSGHLSGEARIIGDIGKPDIYLNLALPDGTLSGRSLAVQGIYSLTADRISVDRMTATYGVHRVTEAAGFIDQGTGSFELGGDYSGVLGKDPFRCSLAFAGKTTPSEGRMEILRNLLRSFSAQIEITKIHLKGKNRPSWSLQGKKQRRASRSRAGLPAPSSARSDLTGPSARVSPTPCRSRST